MSGRTFIFREDWFEFLGDLNEKQQERVIHCVWCYAFGQELPKLSQIERIAFNCIKGTVDRDMEKYEERRKKNQENGRKGGRPRSEKTQNNPEKPFGFENNQMVSAENQMVSGVSRSVCNNNPIPISSNAIKGITASSPSLSSPSPGDGEAMEEEKQERILLSYFFFEKNFLRPERELERMRSFNSLPERKVKWADMTPDERRGVAGLWESEEQKKAKKEGRADTRTRMPPEYLAVWRNVFDTLAGTEAPEELIRDALLDGISIGGRSPTTGKIPITCPDRLRIYIESHTQEFLPALQALLPITFNCTLQPWSR